jgi:hypothetical protein
MRSPTDSEAFEPAVCSTHSDSAASLVLDALVNRRLDSGALSELYESFVADNADGDLGSIDHFAEQVVTEGTTELNPTLITAKDSIRAQNGTIVVGMNFIGGDSKVHDFVLDMAAAWSDAVDKLIVFEASDHAKAFDVKFTGGDKFVGRSIHVQSALGHNGSAGQQYNARYLTLHEIGHALGLEHEHFNPEIGWRWESEDTIIASIKAKLGVKWSKRQVQNQITTPRAKLKTCPVGSAPDPSSVMGYQVWPEWNKDGKKFTPGQKLSDKDIACVRELYGIGN